MENPSSIIEIPSIKGPVHLMIAEALNYLKAGNNIRARRYRNRKLGDYLKELDLTEGRGTGIPTIQKELQANRSERAVFETDDERTYFFVEIPCHKDFVEPEMREIDREELANIRFEYKYLQKYQSALSFLASHNAKRGEILEFIHVSDNYYNKTKYISALLGYELIEMTKENLQDPNQSYRITEKGLRYLEILKREQFWGKE